MIEAVEDMSYDASDRLIGTENFDRPIGMCSKCIRDRTVFVGRDAFPSEYGNVRNDGAIAKCTA
ncbi:MAG TPA: hypothetical protein V6D16_22235 [Candidatus Obscuribacterales bacterium]